MAQCLSNFPCSHLISSQKGTAINPSSRTLQFLSPNGINRNTQKGFFIRANAAPGSNGRDNLDFLQRNGVEVAPQQQQQQPIKKRVPKSAPIGLWDRFPTARTVGQMMETMDRLMDDPLTYANIWAVPQSSENGSYRRGRTPWEIIEGEKEYKLRFNMPGMTKQDVKVWVEEKMLVVKAEKEVKEGGGDAAGEENDGGGDWPAKSYGKYSWRIALPENIEFEKIKAEVKDGVLYISIPKANVRSKVLDISVQ